MEGDRENMGVLDRLENLGQELSAGKSELHKVQTPTEVFIDKLKSKGYNMEEMAPVLRTQGNQLIISGAGSGKALSNDTKVRTPDGFKPIGEMQVGDLVIGGDGNSHKVSGVFPQGKKSAYKIVLSDGQTILCCKDHLWNVKVVRDCNNKKDVKIGTYSTKWLHSNFNNSTFVLEMVGDCVEDIEFTEEMSERLTEITREAAIEKYNTGKTMYECLIKRLINEDIQLRRHYVNIVLESEFVFNKVGDGQYKFNSKKYSNIVLEFFKELTKSVGYTVDEKGIFSKKPLEIMEIKKTLVEKEMTCITVDSPDHTFVIEDWVVTHNTTTLIFKIMYDIISGEATKIVNINDNNIRVTDKIWVSTFLKSGAEELKKRLGVAQTEMGYFDTSDGIVFSTLHAEFKRALTAMGVKLNLMSNSDCISMIKKTADSLRIRHKNGKNLTQEDYFQIQGIITYARNRLDNKRYDNPACEEYGITPIILDSLIDGYKKRRDVENKHDFEDLQELLYDALYTNPNPAVQKFISERYNYIYLDEFQDTSQIQYAILKWYGVNYLSQNTGSARGKMVAVGDDDQAIYSWRGSDVDIITWQFEQDFSPVVNQLTTNYRCPNNILEPVINSIVLNKKRHIKELKSSREGGEMYAYSFADNRGMIMRLMNDIEEDLQKGYNIVILCRTNFDGMIPAFTLEQQHRFDFSISGTNMTLNSALPRSIFRCASLFTERSTNAVRQSLELLVGRQNAWKIKEFVYVLQNDKESIFTIDLEDIKFSVPFLYDLISTLREYRDRNEDIEGLKYLYNYMMTEVYQGDSTYCENARAYIELLLVIIDTHNFENVFDFCEKIQEYSDNLVLRVGKPKVPIQIATVHEYKGKERDSVYIWNDSTDIFPSKRADLSNDEELEEERRVHYIAWTRAKKKLTVYAKRGQQGRFLIECKTDVKNGEIIGGRI